MAIVDLDYTSSSDEQESSGGGSSDPASVVVLKRHRDNIVRWIKVHNSFDAIDIASKLSPDQQVQLNKQLVFYLRQLKNDIDKELEDLHYGN